MSDPLELDIDRRLSSYVGNRCALCGVPFTDLATVRTAQMWRSERDGLWHTADAGCWAARDPSEEPADLLDEHPGISRDCATRLLRLLLEG